MVRAERPNGQLRIEARQLGMLTNTYCRTFVYSSENPSPLTGSPDVKEANGNSRSARYFMELGDDWYLQIESWDSD
jgi:hypothetical protein